ALSSQPAGITDSSRLNPASSLPIPSAYQCFYVLLSKRLWVNTPPFRARLLIELKIQLRELLFVYKTR
ncbi:MAG: hypothetical protein LBD31_10620, partial [Treponema sp.]|nr:hypothetical protein [Treponema sp.]